jgi:pimeloyl-ACP methyl ester carboxylesterase
MCMRRGWTALDEAGGAPTAALNCALGRALHSMADAEAHHEQIWAGKDESGVVMLLVHGVGQSKADYSFLGPILARHAHSVIAFDLPGHGDRDGDCALSLDELVDDACTLLGDRTDGHKLVVVGHSLGACVATQLAARLSSAIPVALVAMEMVESVALESLDRALSHACKRPTSFPSAPLAVEWALSQGMFHHEAAAVATIPPLLREGSSTERSLVWKHDILSSSDRWRDWITGQTARFLGFAGPKLMLLSQLPNDDPELLRAQMEGRFATRTIPAAGHFLQADNPIPVAAAILEFLASVSFIPRSRVGGYVLEALGEDDVH